MAVWVLLVGFVNVPLITAAFVPLKPPVNPPVTVGTDQLYNVPKGTIPFVPFVGVAVNNTPLQLTVVIAVITGVGFTLMDSVNVEPIQLPDTGVII